MSVCGIVFTLYRCRKHNQERGYLPEVDVAFSHPVDDLVSPLPPVVAVDVHFGHGCLVHDEPEAFACNCCSKMTRWKQYITTSAN